jgi:hypothetical protein
MGNFGLADSSESRTADSVMPLYIPIVGPFIMIATGTTLTDNGVFFLAVDGIVQTGSAAMLIAGLVSPTTKLVRNDVSVSAHPIVGKGTLGLGLSGTL